MHVCMCSCVCVSACVCICFCIFIARPGYAPVRDRPRRPSQEMTDAADFFGALSPSARVLKAALPHYNPHGPVRPPLPCSEYSAEP